ncbi:MAG: ABC transporter, partial [Patescibacteria group bacterium]
AAAFIYRPRVLFLDEPTIGLDVVVQRKVREFVKEYQRSHKATIILTSHYLDAVRELCQRLVIIDHGRIMFDGATDDLIKKHVDHKRIVLTFDHPVPKADLEKHGTVVEHEELKAALQVKREKTTEQAAILLTQFPVVDISIEEPSLENVVRELFTKRDYA